MARTGKWWLTELASVVDPISLDPVRALRYPPFELNAQKGGSHADSDWYDGALLASYLVSTGNFTHPISRRELERDECEALDRYLIENRLRGGGAAAAYDRRAEYAAGNPPEGSQLATLRAEADIILQSLFAGHSARRTEGAARPSQAAISADGNMRLVDDDAYAHERADEFYARDAEAAAAAAAAAVASSSAAPAAEGAAGTRDGGEVFPTLQSAAASRTQGQPLPLPSGRRHGFAPSVRNAWGVPQHDTYHGGGGGAAAPAPAPGRAGGTASGQGGWARAAAQPGAAASGGGGGGWASAVGRPAGSGIAHSINRTSTAEPPAAAPAKTKGQKKAAAKQRKAVAAAAAASTGADTTSGADADADAAVAEVAAFEAAERARMAAAPPPAAVLASLGGNGAGVGPRPSGGTPGPSCGGPGCAQAPSSSAGSSGGGSSIGGPRILRPASMDDAKARHRTVASQLKSRLEKGGMSQAEVADTMAQFKSASAAFISAPTAAAAQTYLETFLGLFGSSGSIHLLLELAGLLPTAKHSTTFATALKKQWSLTSLPVVETAPHRPQVATATGTATGEAGAAAGAAGGAPAGAGAVAGVGATPRPPAASAAPAPALSGAKWAVASGPTYGQAPAGGSVIRRMGGATPSKATPVVRRVVTVGTPTLAPRVTLAYAAAQQAAARTPPGVASMSGGGGGSSSDDDTGASPSSSRAAAAAAAAQFEDELSAGATAALRAAMQYGGGGAAASSRRRGR